ncbi:hypothetical protein WKW79_19010 [Variovorax robiniae]|uniref:TyeA family type III secretion system gatekeeper subunit n=1 Tax=Variovorax robiniae TaxID=1836199 RepID=A0ABU8XCB7_9BURK
MSASADVPRRPRTMGASPPSAAPVPAPAGVAEPARRAPRAMASSPVQPMPTQGMASAAPATPVPATAAAAAVPVPTPRPMAGEVRMGLQARPEDLAARFPALNSSQLTLASTMLGSVVAGTFNWSQAQDFGVELQKQYGAIVERLLEVASSNVMRTAPQYLARLLSLLEQCAQDYAPPSTIVGRWLRKDKPRALDLHRNEIDELKKKLSRACDELEQPIAAVITIRGDLAGLAEQLVAASMACEWLMERDWVAEEVRLVLADRALMLTRTAGLVQEQQLQSLASAGNMDALRDRIQEGVLIALPSWLSTMAAVPADSNETQRFVARDDLRQIIDRIKN